MSDATEIKIEQDPLPLVHQALEEGNLPEVQQLLADLHPAEIADLLESLPSQQRADIWEQVAPEVDGDVLIHVNDHVRESLMRDMDSAELVAATEGMAADDLADLLSEMPEEFTQQVLESLDDQNRQRLESVRHYPEDTAGGLMNVDAITVRPDISLDVVSRYLRLLGRLPETTDNLMVVDRAGRYEGMLSLIDLVTRPQDQQVSEVMTQGIEGIRATTSAQEVTMLFERRDLVTAPVIDDEGRLLGRITIDDVVDVIRDKADSDFLGRAGLTAEEDIFAPIFASSRRRAVWLGINLLTAFLASWVISRFDGTIEQLVSLAVLMPVVASMGGIAGSQTLTLVIRAMALGQVSQKNTWRLVQKELAVGLVNGLIWSMVIALIAYLWFGSSGLGVVIGIAIIINFFSAALSGATLPILLQRLGADPALSGSVILTTVTDVIGFFAFLGLANQFLL